MQWTFLAVVLAVSVLAATLLGTLFLLAGATETFAARAALTDASADDVEIQLRVAPNGPLTDVLAGADAAANELLGDVPHTRTVTTQGTYLSISREGRKSALGYLASSDVLDDMVAIRSGRAPQPSHGGPVELLVPLSLLRDLGLELGDTFTMAEYADLHNERTFRAVGTYVVRDDDDPAWLYDRFGGAGHIPNAVIPFTGGMVTTDGFGPLYTDPSDVEAIPLESIRITYTPDFSATSLGDVRAILDRSDDIDRLATRNIGDPARSVVVNTNLTSTLGGVAGSLAVTRSSVLVTGLLLLVLAVAALSQTARLMAERRYTEQHLMVARGGSSRQLLRLGLIEALALGALTAAVAAPLARLAYLALTRQRIMVAAGMHIDPGIPARTWVVTGLVGLVLVIILVAPLMRRQGTFVDAEQVRSRPGRRAAFQRSGLDIAVVVLAALAYWQLRGYQSPVLANGGVARVDPLLAAGPALALLAGALVAVRLIPPASRALEAIAARGRRAVTPLAAWEVGRRPARAISAILLLTLAVSIGAFSMTFLVTWHHSQADQALYQHPPDAIVTRLDAPWIAQRAQVDDGSFAATASAVVNQRTPLGDTPEGRGRNEFSGVPVALVATDADGLAMLGRGRLNEIDGAAIAAEVGGDVPEEINPIAIPGHPQQLALDAKASATQDLGDLRVQLNAVLRNDSGDYQTLPLGQLSLDGATHHLIAPIATSGGLKGDDDPLYLVGLQATWISFNADPDAVALDSTTPLGLTLSLDNVAAESTVLVVQVPGQPSIVESTPLDIPSSLEWTATNNGVAIDTMTPQDDDFHVRVIASGQSLMYRPASLVLTAAHKATPVRLVANAAALHATALDVADQASLQIGGALVPAYIAASVPSVGGDTLGRSAVVANIARLEVAVIQSGGSVVSPSAWWVGIDDEALPAWTASLPDAATVTTQSGVANDLKNDPLRVAIQAALWLVTGAAVVLAALGFAVHAVVTVRAREIELAQLRAIGVLRGQLLRIVSAENALLSILGLVFGMGLGLALSYLVGPLVSVGSDGRPPLPAVIVQIPWPYLGLLVAEVVVVLLVASIIVGVMLRRIRPAQMLRLGDER